MLLLALALACSRPAPKAAGPGGPEDSGAPPDTDAGCDPTVPSVALPSFTADVEHLHGTVDPTELDPAAVSHPAARHEVWVPTDPSVPLRDELLVFLPGTGNTPDGFDKVAQVALRAGYPVIVLAWPGEDHPATPCYTLHPDDMAAMEACRTAAFEEKAYGNGVSEVEDIPPGDSVVGRLTRLLSWLDAEYPSADAGRFLDGDAPRWSSIAIAGFSQGALIAGLLAKDHAVARAVLFAGGCDSFTTDDGEVYLAASCSAPRATPVERIWALSHARDETNEDLAVHEALGLPALGGYADAGEESPAYCTDTHLLAFNLPSAGDDPTKFHLAVAHDNFMPVDADGVPVLAEDIFYLFTAAPR